MLCYGRSQAPKCDMAVREKVRSLLEEKGPDWLRVELERVDSVSASRIYREDIYRITRALEVYYQTGRPLSSFPLSDTLRSDVDFILIGLEREKSELIERINRRVDIMFSSGAVEEMKALIAAGARKDWPSMEAIGYREWFDALESGEFSLSLIKDAIRRNSIKYAKRQMTFFRSFPDAVWFHPDDTESIRRYLVSRGIGNMENVE